MDQFGLVTRFRHDDKGLFDYRHNNPGGLLLKDRAYRRVYHMSDGRAWQTSRVGDYSPKEILAGRTRNIFSGGNATIYAVAKPTQLVTLLRKAFELGGTARIWMGVRHQPEVLSALAQIGYRLVEDGKGNMRMVSATPVTKTGEKPIAPGQRGKK
jgi:hypothetical protein